MSAPLALGDLLKKRYWIFDLDGTLTLPLHDFTEMRRILNVPVGVGILEHLNAQPEPLRTALNERLMAIEFEVAYRAEPMPLANALIHRLEKQGCQLAILTRNRRDCVDIVLQRLGLSECFPLSQIIACECAPPKPSPVGIHRLIDQWDCAPEDCVMVGDYLYDLQAGREAGISTLHFNPHQGPRWPELTDLELQSFEPILNCLE